MEVVLVRELQDGSAREIFGIRISTRLNCVGSLMNWGCDQWEDTEGSRLKPGLMKSSCA